LRRCAECVSAQQCKTARERWDNLPSLSERTAALEKTFEPPPNEDILQTYRRVHLQIFGNRSWTKPTKKNEATFEKVRKLCVDEGIDVELYIRAQMHGLSYWLNDPKQNKKKIGFMPTMMLGAKARHRYNAYLYFRYREYRNVDRPAFSAETWEGKLLSTAYEDELSIGLDYTHGLYSGLAVDFADVVKQEYATSMWWALIGWKDVGIPDHKDHAGLLHQKLIISHGEEWILRAREFLRVRAACEVAETFKHGLSDRVGFKGDFSWDAFAKMIKRVVVRREPRPHADLSDVPGIAYER
jgi:hypothetical protein